jgi:hypothetical protein
MWRRVLQAAVLAGALLVATAGPAAAQYGGGGGGGGGGQENPQAVLSVADATLCPGQSVAQAASVGSFGSGTVTVYLLRLVAGATPQPLGTATVAGDGSVSTTVTIPASAAASNYLLYMEGPAIPGGVRVLSSAAVVGPGFCPSGQSLRRPQGAGAAGGEGGPQAGGAPSPTAPAAGPAGAGPSGATTPLVARGAASLAGASSAGRARLWVACAAAALWLAGVLGLRAGRARRKVAVRP